MQLTWSPGWSEPVVPLGSKANVLEVIEVEPSNVVVLVSVDPLIPVAPVVIGKPSAVRMLFVVTFDSFLNAGKQLPVTFKLPSIIDELVLLLPFEFVKHFCSLMCILM